MAPTLKHPRSSYRAAIWLSVATLTVSMAVAGCSSASKAQATTNAQSASADAATGAVAPPRQIEGLEVRTAGSATALDVRADRPLVWTSYRDRSGNLVIELPNSEPVGDLASLTREDGLISQVRMESEISADRPLTRLTIVTRQEAEHTLAAEAGSLELRLTPISAEQRSEPAAADVAVADVEVSYEPLPRNDAPATEDTEVAELDVEPLVQEPMARETVVQETETVQEARRPSPANMAPDAIPGPPPTGNPATELRRVSVENGVVRVSGNGGFVYSTFALENPARFVVDLEGVVNTSPRSIVSVGQDGVKQVRVAQFKPFPNAVSRVVFDLEQPIEPTIQVSDSGLTLDFGNARPASSASAPPAAPAIEPRDETADVEASDDWRETEPWPELPPPGTPTTPQPADNQPVDIQPVDIQPIDNDADTGFDTAIDEPRPVQLQPVNEPVDVVVTTPIDPAVEPAVEDTAEILEETAVEPLYEDPVYEETVEPDVRRPIDSYVDPEPVLEEIDELDPPPAPIDPAPAPLPPVQVPLPGDTGTGDTGTLPPAGATSDVAMFEAAEVQFAQTEVRAEPETTEIQAEVVGETGEAFTGPPISLSLKDSDIKDVLRSFATFTGLNVVVHPGVQGSVTVELQDVPWDQALDLILKINGLDYVLEGNIMRIATSDTLAEEARARRALLAARAQEIPLATVIRSISYASADQIATLLQGSRNRGILSSRGSVTVDARTNKLIIKELPSNLNTVLAVIDNLDTAEPQVLIEARIVETTKQFTRSLGVNWSFDAISDEQFGNTTGLQFPHQGTANGGVQLLTGGANGFLDINLGNVLNTFQLDLSLQAAENEGLASVLSAPRIATLNNQEATIQSGLQIPIQTVANNTVTVQFVNATLELGVTPQITPDGTVIMDIEIAKREPQPAFALPGATNAPISTKEARTRVIVRDGGTTVIGGIYEISNDRGENRVPGLANVPILGHLFKNRTRGNNNEELLIFITPRVIQL